MQFLKSLYMRDNILEQLEPFEGFNVASTELEFPYNMYEKQAPKLRGACTGILIFKEGFVILREDDDHFFNDKEDRFLSKEEICSIISLLEKWNKRKSISSGEIHISLERRGDGKKCILKIAIGDYEVRYLHKHYTEELIDLFEQALHKLESM